MKKLCILMLVFLFSSSAMSANWVHLATDVNHNKFSIDTTSISKVSTKLSTTGPVRSAWAKIEFPKERSGAKHMLHEMYFKCGEQKTAVNTILTYSPNGSVVSSRYNVSGTSVDFASFESSPPNSVINYVSQKVCALTAY